MTDGTFDRSFWEERWSQALREHADQVAHRPPNAHLVTEVADLPAGRALDAGCGHGSDTLWLAARGWQVTAVDFSATALAHARSTAQAVRAQVAERIDWVEGDLTTWTPQPRHYDLLACLYVHVAGSVAGMVRRTAAWVKFTGEEHAMQTRDRLGFSPGAYRLIGVCELAGAIGALIGLALRPLGIAALAGLVLVAIGACAAQIRLRNPPSEARLAVVALVLSAAALTLQIATA